MAVVILDALKAAVEAVEPPESVVNLVTNLIGRTLDHGEEVTALERILAILQEVESFQAGPNPSRRRRRCFD